MKRKIFLVIFLSFLLLFPFGCNQEIYIRCKFYSLECKLGKSISLGEIEIDTNAKFEELEFSSANTDVAQINNERINCVGIGKTIIYIFHKNSNKKDFFELTVIPRTSDEIFDEINSDKPSDPSDVPVENNFELELTNISQKYQSDLIIIQFTVKKKSTDSNGSTVLTNYLDFEVSFEEEKTQYSRYGANVFVQLFNNTTVTMLITDTKNNSYKTFDLPFDNINTTKEVQYETKV